MRLAINYAIEKEFIMELVLNGGGKIATSPIAPVVFRFTKKN